MAARFPIGSQAEADHILRLPDGRSLSYAQYGDPAGFPIVSAHGGLACRMDVASAARVAEECGVRLISPDRPGVGRSDPQPGRTVLDWARDVGELLDILAIDRFAAMGWSLGGQYAAAVGYALSARVSRVAIIAGALPLSEPGVFDGLPSNRSPIHQAVRACTVACAAVPPRHAICRGLCAESVRMDGRTRTR